MSGEEKTIKCGMCGAELSLEGKVLKAGDKPPAPVPGKKEKKQKNKKEAKIPPAPREKEKPKKSIWD